MWQTDTVLLLVKTVTSGYAGDIITWVTTGATSVICDVQDINKETVFKEYGISGNEFKQVYDYTHGTWTIGNQVKFEGSNYWVKLVNKYDKIGSSNHTFVILEKVY